MNETNQLEKFTEDIIQEVLLSADSEDSGSFRIDTFTSVISDYLIEAGEIEDIDICYFKARGMQLNGYSASSEEECIDLFITIFNQNSSPISVTKTQVETAFKQAENVIKKAFSGFHQSLEEASEAFDAFQRLYHLQHTASRCRLFLLTDGLVKKDDFETEGLEDLSVSYHVWDIQRVYRFASSGQKFEPIEIDFETTFGSCIPCLSLVSDDSDYEGYLAVIPGRVLSNIYEKYGPRLLERNVRSFLQARGKVNKGIRTTILEEPHRFFAYNNGITATADHIEFKDSESGNPEIKRIRNLQIVNGGQTTASLYHVYKKDKAELNSIFVQAKLSVIPNDHIEEIVPLISRYANTQNRVNDADFSANDPFHVRIEELSRTVWAPAVDGSNKQTRWFYERARGQYMDAKGREFTPARKRQFDAANPNRQKFTKTDLAKYENTWRQLPYIVSLGAQKNFADFSIRLKERGKVDPDIQYYEKLIAKAILFKQTERIVSQQKFGGYRANIVTYTLSLIFHNTSQRIDLQSIWKNQDLSPVLKETIADISHLVFNQITNPPGARNITEWCKRKECWERMLQVQVTLSEKLENELIDVSAGAAVDIGIDKPNLEESELIHQISSMDANEWFQISKWAKETGNLQPWQRSLCYSIGKAINHKKNLSRKQAKHGEVIIKEVSELGFKYSET